MEEAEDVNYIYSGMVVTSQLAIVKFGNFTIIASSEVVHVRMQVRSLDRFESPSQPYLQCGRDFLFSLQLPEVA